MVDISILIGGILTYPSEKYENQWEGLPPILWTIKKRFQTTSQLVYGRYIYTDWWYTYPPEKMKVNGKDYPIYYGK